MNNTVGTETVTRLAFLSGFKTIRIMGAITATPPKHPSKIAL